MADLIVVLKATSSFAQKAAGISPSLNSNNYGKGGGGGRTLAKIRWRWQQKIQAGVVEDEELL